MRVSSFRDLSTPDGAACLMRFDESNPEAIRWADTRSAQLVAEVTATTQAAIRDIISTAITEGIPPREAAKLIKSAVGLRSDQVTALSNFRQRLLDAEARAQATGKTISVKRGNTFVKVTKNGLSAIERSEMVSRYADRLLRDRALMIARTETMAASVRGQQELWLQAVKKGFLRGTERQIWIVTPDDKLCPICRKMRGKTAPLGGLFDSPNGPVLGPPLHPNCRCAVGLTIVDVAPPRSRR